MKMSLLLTSGRSEIWMNMQNIYIFPVSVEWETINYDEWQPHPYIQHKEEMIEENNRYLIDNEVIV